MVQLHPGRPSSATSARPSRTARRASRWCRGMVTSAAVRGMRR